MEGAKGGCEDEVGEGMQCSDHPYRNNPGGICAFCLQEKLGKLVSSSFPNAIFPSSSSSPSFRSDIGGVEGGGGGGGGGASSTSLSVQPTSALSSYSTSKDCHYHGNCSRRARLPFLLSQKKKKSKEMMGSDDVGIVLKRSKSTTAPRRGRFLVESEDAVDYSPQKRGFWSFFYLSKSAVNRKMDKGIGSAVAPRESKLTAAMLQTHASRSHKPKDLGSPSLTKKEELVGESESSTGQATASSSSFGRKVSRSRSVGCGSRSFSGDFFERISTGFGDCALRRVESQREGKPKSSGAHRAGASGGPENQLIKERIKCGGIFGGFSMASSSSPSSSSSYCMPSSVEDNMNGRSSAGAGAVAGPLSHCRSKSWGWAFASPMRALSKPSSSKVEYKDAGKREITPNKPNLAAVPSLLAVRG